MVFSLFLFAPPTITAQCKLRQEMASFISQNIAMQKIENFTLCVILPGSTELFTLLYKHSFKSDLLQNHVYLLIKCVVSQYITLRCHHSTKIFNETIHKNCRREISKKLTLICRYVNVMSTEIKIDRYNLIVIQW